MRRPKNRKQYGLIFYCILLVTCINSCSNHYNTLPEDVILNINGIEPDRVFLHVVDDTVNRSEFYYGEKVFFEFADIKGLEKIDSLVYPGMSMLVLQGEDTILNEPDIFPELSEGTSINNLTLSSYMRMIFSYRENPNFLLAIKIWDKKGANTCSFQMPFSIKPNDNFDLTEEGLSYKAVYFFDEKNDQSINSNRFYQNSKILLQYEDVTGFGDSAGIIFPSYELRIADSLGHVMAQNKNLFEDFSQTGISIENFKDIFPLEFKIKKGLSSGTAYYEGILRDTRTQNFIRIKTKLFILPEETKTRQSPENLVKIHKSAASKTS